MNPDSFHKFLLPFGQPGTVGMSVGLLLNKNACARFVRQCNEGRIDVENDEQVHAALLDMLEGVLADVKLGLMVPTRKSDHGGMSIVAPPPGFKPDRNVQ